jgi:carboxyl-terminal processing protease
MKIKKLLNKKIFSIFLSLLLTSGLFLSGFYLGLNSKSEIEKISNITNKENEITKTVDFEPFWKVWNTINEKYVAKENINDQEKVWGAIQGLTASLNDPYSVFMPPLDAEIFEEDIQGNFSGVGMEIGIRDDTLTVISPLKNTPAEKAGMKSGDKILEIDGTPTTNFTTDQAVKLIRGEKGTPVKLSVLRKGESDLREITIIRDNIDIPTIKTELKDSVFIISLYSFSAVSPGLFREALNEFIDSGVSKLILDLRGNPGGYMEAAIDMASWFLPSGKTVVIENFGEGQEEKVHRSRGYDIFNNNLKFVILVNEGSASASEILAGALQEHNIATLVGSQTFGKGSVQELVKITPETSLKITVARWLTPNGNSISEQGLTPDVEVEMTLEDYEQEKDPQLEKALEILNK